jgi:hypothetical protein
MNKRFWIFTCITGLALIGLAALYAWINHDSTMPVFSDKEMTDKRLKLAAESGLTNIPEQSVVEPVSMSQPIRLAVGGLGLEDKEQNQELGDLVTADLTGAPGLSLVERQDLDAVLRELHLSLHGFVRAKDAVRAGKLLKVDWFLFGTEAKIDGTNCIVVRIVDARTGILRDAGVASGEEARPKIAAGIAAFVSQSRQDAASAQSRIYLAIGAFEDVSVNNRLADFPAQVRGYLTSAYRHNKVTLLEREYVETLLREVRLDLAGLTEEGGTNLPPPLQSAFWLVSGQYQSYETTNLQVEFNLDVRRIFGKTRHFTLCGLPGESVCGQIKTAIDQTLDQSAGHIVITRASEARAQMTIGKDLLRPYLGGGNFHNLDLIYFVEKPGENSPAETAKEKRNVEEAMRAFEAVILLEPTNREAKMYLATCLRKSVINRPDAVRDHYRELIDEPTQDQWTEAARKALMRTFERSWWGGPTPEEEVRWYESAALQTTNVAARDFYQQRAKAAEEEAIIRRGDSPEAEELAEKKLFEGIRQFRDEISKNNVGDLFCIKDYARTMHSDPAVTAQKLTELLPKMESAAPEMKPYLLSAVLRFQVETSAPVVAEFQRTLNACIENPDQLFHPNQFWHLVGWSVYEWCFEITNYPLAVNLMEGKRRAAAQGHAEFNEQEKVRLAYAYVAEERWKDALDVFESLGNQPVEVYGYGPWGSALRPIYGDKMAAYCRSKLGLSAPVNPLEFNLGKPVLCFCTPSSAPSTFITDNSSLWIGMGGQLLQLDFELKTNLVINLPVDADVPITAMCLTSSNVWIGTGGAGLIQYDKANRKCRRITEADGLMMNYLSDLYVAGNFLWIGFSDTTGGGLGQLDLNSQKLTSFMPSLKERASSSSHNSQLPPEKGVDNIMSKSDGEIFMHVDRDIREFDVAHNLWGSLPRVGGEWVNCFAISPEWLVKGLGVEQIVIEIGTNLSSTVHPDPSNTTKQVVSRAEKSRLDQIFKTNGIQQYIFGTSVGEVRPKGKLEVQSLYKNSTQILEDPGAIPNPPTTMALDGDDLWVGGAGFLTLVDLKESKVRKYCHINAPSVNRIQVGGGYVWAQFDWHLYRVPLGELK